MGNKLVPFIRGFVGNRTTMDFSAALYELKSGIRVQRVGWDRNVLVMNPFLYIIPKGEEDRVPWLASSEDLLAEDWITVKGPIESCVSCYWWAEGFCNFNPESVPSPADGYCHQFKGVED